MHRYFTSIDKCTGIQGHCPPSVVYSEGDLAYRAGRRPTLRLLPSAYSSAESVPYASVGVVPIGNDGEHLVLAAISSMRVDETHHIHVFRSDGGTWTHKPLALGSDAYMHLSPTKAIALGGGDLGWVDLRQCIIVCNVLDDDPRPRLIPLPKPAALQPARQAAAQL